jgi:hypothetical protein
MNTSSSTDSRRHGRRASRALAVFSLIALALAVSPTALAKERGRPGAPSAQQANLSDFFHVLRSQLRSVSWSD